MRTGRVLIVDDDPSMCEVLQTTLTKEGFEASWRLTPEAARDALRAEEYDVVVTDLNLRAGSGGLELCQEIVESHPEVPVVVITAFGSLDTAVAAIRSGAYDFITKPFDFDLLLVSLRRAVERRALRGEVRRLRQRELVSRASEELLGDSVPMRRLLGIVLRVADSDSSVLIMGESGTGKELVASALHRASSRRDGPFVAVNCAAVPETLLESELFGHTKGAFTDARTSRDGLLVQASGGTLLLDEIGDMPLPLQPKLLRALQERRVRPVGGTSEVAFDVRIVASTNRDLEQAVASKTFREDLFYRLNVIAIDVPPLRTRGNDILLLAQAFVQRFASRAKKELKGLSPQVAKLLLAYAWPGNVRELQNCIERAVAMSRYEELTVDDLPDRVREQRADAPLVIAEDPSQLLSLAELERRYIAKVLEAVGGNRTLASDILGLDRKTLRRKLGSQSSTAEE